MVTIVDLTTLPPISPISIINETTQIATSLTTSPPTLFESNNNNILSIASLVGGATFLGVSIAMICVVFWFQRRKRQLNTISSVAAQPQNQGIIFISWYASYTIIVHANTAHTCTIIRHRCCHDITTQ